MAYDYLIYGLCLVLMLIMIIFDVDYLTLNRLSFDLQSFHPLYVCYPLWTCYFLFAFNYYGSYTMGVGLEGINQYNRKYDTSMNSCKCPHSL